MHVALAAAALARAAAAALALALAALAQPPGCSLLPRLGLRRQPRPSNGKVHSWPMWNDRLPLEWPQVQVRPGEDLHL